jgi:glutamate dehydrogenase (NAD(P)+)
VFESIRERIRANTVHVLESARSRAVLPSVAAADFSIERIRRAMSYRRGSIQ